MVPLSPLDGDSAVYGKMDEYDAKKVEVDSWLFSPS